MIKIAILDTNSSANKGSIGRLEGMITCLNDNIPNCRITVFHRYFDNCDKEFIRLKSQYSNVNFEQHLWFNEKNSFIATGIYFLINSLKFNITNKINSEKFNEYDAFIDINFIEPEKLVDEFKIINFIGVLFVLLSLNNSFSIKRPLIVCSATIGPYSGLINFLANHFLNKVDLITFRERYSLKYIEKLKINKPHKVLTGDLAFLMNPPGKIENELLIKKIGIDIKDSFIGIAPAVLVNSNLNEENYIILITELSKFIIEELNYKIIYLANTYQDVHLIKEISNKVNSNRVILLPFEFNARETKGIISLCDSIHMFKISRFGGFHFSFCSQYRNCILQS